MKNEGVAFPESTIMPWTNSVGRSGSGAAAAVTAGQVVKLRGAAGGLFGVAIGDVAVNAVGDLKTQGAFWLPKAAGTAFSEGQVLGYDFTNNRVTADLTSGRCVQVRKAAASADTQVLGVLNPMPRVVVVSRAPTAGEDTANQVDIDLGFPANNAVIRCARVFDGTSGARVERASTTVTLNPGGSSPNVVRVANAALVATDLFTFEAVEAVGS